MAKKEGLRRQLSRLFSKSDINLKEPQRQENQEDGPRLVGARDPQHGCDNGRRKKRHWKRGAFQGARDEDVSSVCTKHASAEPSNSSRPQKPPSKARALSCSEPDLWRNGLLRRFGSLNWRKRRSSHVQLLEHPGNLASEPWAAGRLWRPSVGSDVDMRNRSDFGPAEETCQPSSQLSETDSAGTSTVPSASFDSLLCWGDGNSWEGPFSISNSSLLCPTAPEMKGEVLELPSVQEENGKAPEPCSKQAEREVKESLTLGVSHHTVVAKPENLNCGLGEATSEHISGAEEPPTATASPSVGRPLEVVGALKSTPAKIRYEIRITMTKEEEEEEDGSARAEPAAGCGERGLPCHPSGQGALSLGVAEFEKTEEQRHEKPARLAPQLSARKEFQKYRGLHGVGTCEWRGPILTAVTGSPAKLRQGSETNPGEGEDRSRTDQLHSVDGTLVEGTGLIAPESPANSFSESSGISLATKNRAFEPKRSRDARRGLFHIQHSMEKTTGGSRSSQSRSGGSVASTSFKWKKAVPDPPKEEAKPSFCKVTAISQMAERAGIRARAKSPSKVSVLLEAWEKGLVGMDTAGPSSSADTRISRSPVHTRRLLPSKVSSCPLSPANDRRSLSSNSSADSRESLSPADTGGSLSPAHPGCPADTTRFRSPANTKRSLSPADTRRSHFPTETRRSHSPAETRQSLSPVDSRQSHFPTETRRSHSPAETRRSLSPVDSRGPLFTPEIRRSHSPAETRQCLSPLDSRRSLLTAEIRRSQSQAETRQCLSPVDSRKSLSLTERRRSHSPAATRQSLSPGDPGRSLFQAETRRSRSPSDARRSFSPADARRPLFLSDTKRSHSPTDNRHTPSPGNTFSPVESRRPLSPANTRDFCFLKDTQYSSSSAGAQHLSSPVESQCTEDNHHSSSSVDIQYLSSLPDFKASRSVADIRNVYSSADARHSTSPADTRNQFSSEETRGSSSPAETRRSFSSADARRSTSPADTRRSFSSEEIRCSTSPGETRCSFSSADARRSTSPADTRRSFSSEEIRHSTSPGETRCSFSSADARRSTSPADTKRSFSSEETRHSSPGDTRWPFSSEETRCPTSPAHTRHSFSSEETRHLTFPGVTRRPFSSEEIRCLTSLANTGRSFSSGETRLSSSPAETRRPFSPTDARRSTSPADTRRSFSSEETRRSTSPRDTRRPFSSEEIRRSTSQADTRHSFSLEETRCSSTLAETRHSFSSADARCSTSLANTGHSFSSGETRHSSSPAETRRPFPPTDARRSTSPADTKHSFSSEENRRTFSSEETRCSTSLANTGHSFSSGETRHSSSPAETRRSSSPAESPTSVARRSRSLSPRRDFTAHRPVFAQVYSPKPKILLKTETQDATNSTVVAESQEVNCCRGVPNTLQATGFQRDSHISSTDGSQEENVLSTLVSNGTTEAQKENHMPSGANSAKDPDSPSETDLLHALVLGSQTESCSSRSASASPSYGSAGGTCMPSVLNPKPFGGSSPLNPKPCVVSSSTIAESQTQWFGPKGGSMVVFRSEQQVIVPQAGSATVYRAGREIIMSSSGAGNVSQPQPERPLALSSITCIPPEEIREVQEDLSDAKLLKRIPALLPNVCDCSVAGPQPESCMTQPRSTGVSNTQRQRCMLVPNPALTSDGDATTLGEGVVPFSTPQRDCSPYSKAAFQKPSSLFTESRSERQHSMPDRDGPLANGPEQESNQSRTEKAGASKPQSIQCPPDAAAEIGAIGTGSLETAPTDQKDTNRTEQRAEQTDRTKVSSVFALEPNIPLAETTNSACELSSQKIGSSNRMAEQEPEEIVEMELFVDTLRNMEPAELRKPLKLHPRPPRPSALAKHAPLPPIHEDHITPKSKVALPTALGALYALAEERNSEEGKEEPKEEEEEEEEEDLEEIENPYLSEDEKVQENNCARKPYPWENKSYKTEEEIGSFLGMLQQGPDDPKAKIIASKSIANQTNLIRANILKGMSLLSGFVDKKVVEEKPYSRLDNSLLYSRFICPEKSPPTAPAKGKEGKCLPLLLTPSVLKVNQECQTSPNGLEMDEAYEHLRFEPPHSGLRAEPSSRAPGANDSSKQMTALSKEAESPSQPEDQDEEKKPPKKVNVRPGKIILYSESGFEGQKREVWGDITNATSWELSHTISIRVVRGGWVMYEKPRFHGRKCVLAEGDVEITNPWTAYHKTGSEAENEPFHIGSLKRVVRVFVYKPEFGSNATPIFEYDYRIPEISLFTEENGEGTKRRFTDSAEDTRIHRQPLKAASIIVHSGLWLVYSKPFFDDDPYILEPGGYPSLQAWGAKDPSICSMHPIKLGCPAVEKPGEPKALVYERPHFQGLSWEINRDVYNLKKQENTQDSKMSTVASLKIMGGCWVGYEKEGFRGHQYLLEEGEYCDWTQWGGYNEELVSLRLIRTDFLDPALVLFEAMDFEEGPSVELSEALPDVELASYGTTTQSIHVLSGVWVAYEDKNFTGEQYILEKGVYRNCEDWGATNCQISSVQPILQVGEHSLHFVSKIQLFSGPDFLGTYIAFTEDQASLPENFIPHSCRVNGGSWILYDGQEFDGEQHILSEGEYPTLTSMGCLFTTDIRSLKKVPIFFSEPSIFLHGLECFEGKEIELNGEVRSLQAEGFNNHVLSVRVKGGIWVLCEHSDFRGRQWLLDCVEITNWVTYSGLQHIGSLYPIKQKRIYFRIKNEELKSFLSVPDDVEDMKAGRVLVSELNDKSSSIWYYEEGLMKNQVAPNMSLQVIGPAGKGTKVVLWSESRVPRQTWQIDSFGRICSQMFEDKLLDVKGGRAYDRDHAILWDSSDERPTQIWAVQVL